MKRGRTDTQHRGEDQQLLLVAGIAKERDEDRVPENDGRHEPAQSNLVRDDPEERLQNRAGPALYQRDESDFGIAEAVLGFENGQERGQNAHEEVIGEMAQHEAAQGAISEHDQHWNPAEKWPVAQIGPGILTYICCRRENPMQDTLRREVAALRERAD